MSHPSPVSSPLEGRGLREEDGEYFLHPLSLLRME
jgi:hypothetical protein